MERTKPALKVEWVRNPSGADTWTTRTVKNGKTYLGGQWLPRAFAEKMGMGK